MTWNALKRHTWRFQGDFSDFSLNFQQQYNTTIQFKFLEGAQLLLLALKTRFKFDQMGIVDPASILTSILEPSRSGQKSFDPSDPRGSDRGSPTPRNFYYILSIIAESKKIKRYWWRNKVLLYSPERLLFWTWSMLWHWYLCLRGIWKGEATTSVHFFRLLLR